MDGRASAASRTIPKHVAQPAIQNNASLRLAIIKCLDRDGGRWAISASQAGTVIHHVVKGRMPYSRRRSEIGEEDATQRSRLPRRRRPEQPYPHCAALARHQFGAVHPRSSPASTLSLPHPFNNVTASSPFGLAARFFLVGVAAKLSFASLSLASRKPATPEHRLPGGRQRSNEGDEGKRVDAAYGVANALRQSDGPLHGRS